MNQFFALKVKASEELLKSMMDDGYERLQIRDYAMSLSNRDIWLAFHGTEIIGFSYAFVPSEEAFDPYVRERVDAIAEHAMDGVAQSKDDIGILIDRIDYLSNNLSKSDGLWIDAFEIRRDWRLLGFGRMFFEAVFSGSKVLALVKTGTEGFWEVVGLRSESNGFFSTPVKLEGVWQCPNGCETDYFLVCGGGDIRIHDPQDAYPELYFRVLADGRYIGLMDDGSPLLAFCLEYAEGCRKMPICPCCKAEAILEVSNNG